jgi:hypothetical protein
MTAVAIGLVMLAIASSPRAQQGAPASKTLVPLAASTLARNPDPLYGTNVTLTAAVERILSRTTFTVDQDKTKSTGQEILIVAPAMTGLVDPNSYVTVMGEVVKFDPGEIAAKAKSYKLDLPADLIASFAGKPAVIASSVLTAALVDVAKRAPPPMTAEETAYDKSMKEISAAFNALRKGVEGKDAAAVTPNVAVLKKGFTQAATLWKSRNTADATQWTQDALTLVDTLEKATAAATWPEATAAAADLAKTCQTCHAAYRERLEDGSYRIRTP